MQDFSGANSGRVGSLLAKCKGNGFDPTESAQIWRFVYKKFCNVLDIAYLCHRIRGMCFHTRAHRPMQVT